MQMTLPASAHSTASPDIISHFHHYQSKSLENGLVLNLISLITNEIKQLLILGVTYFFYNLPIHLSTHPFILIDKLK